MKNFSDFLRRRLFLLLLLLLPLIIFTVPVQSSTTKLSSSSPHFIKSIRRNSVNQTQPKEYFELTHPLPSDNLTPSCSIHLLNHSFGNTYGSPPVTVDYSPPEKKCKWSRVILEFRAACKGEQYDRIAGVWLDGVELLRTSTAEPTQDGIFWTVRKDVTRYSSLLTKSDLTLSVMLENLVNDEFTGVYHVNVSFLFYPDTSVKLPLSVVSEETEAHKLNRKLISVKNHEIQKESELDIVKVMLNGYDTPADLIMPISGAGNDGFWFRIQNESDMHRKKVKIDKKTYRAVLELYVSSHGDDEFWYMNPPDSYVKANQLNTGRAHGAYREVLVTIDEKLVGTVFPFPVIFTGGINPLFWEPIVSTGAFDLPSYDIDLTPFLGLLLDKKEHSIGLAVADGISFWLVDANLHLWLDKSEVKAQTNYKVPSMEMERSTQIERLDGEFEIEAERNSKFIGWVKSSAGNLTTHFEEEVEFKNKIKYDDDGTSQDIDQTIKTKTKMKIKSNIGVKLGELEVKRKYPLKIKMETQPAGSNGDDTKMMMTNIVLRRSEKFYWDKTSSLLNVNQNCTGWMLVKDHTVLSGSAEHHQKYNYQDNELGCYWRSVDVVDGNVVGDERSGMICID